MATKRKAKEWALKEEKISDCELTDPESLFATRLKLRFPGIYARLCRSNAPYKGTKFRSDFTIAVEHYHYAGVVVEIQGGIYSRGRSGHSSSTGLKRDYNKVTTAQLNGWFILQVAPDNESLFSAAEFLSELLERLHDENEENEALLEGYAA